MKCPSRLAGVIKPIDSAMNGGDPYQGCVCAPDMSLVSERFDWFVRKLGCGEGQLVAVKPDERTLDWFYDMRRFRRRTPRGGEFTETH